MQSDSREPLEPPVALVSGGSAGLGRVIAETLLAAGYHVIIAGRNKGRLEATQQELQELHGSHAVTAVAADATDAGDVEQLFHSIQATAGRLDVLVNCVGTSDRGLTESLAADRLRELFEANVITALLCSQAALPMLRESGGTIVNIGSLASKVGARYLGGYPAAKHALAGLTQQMRLELEPDGVHVALVCPGPIRRDDAGSRYSEAVDTDLPPQATSPGGGTRVSGLPPEQVAQTVLRCVRHRLPEVVMPRHLRILIAVGNAFPRLGDWLLLKFTSTKA